MNLFNNQINKSEERIRLHWLFSTFIAFILYPLALVTFFLTMEIPFPEGLLIGLIGVSARIVPFWVIWHCAYKKYGTKLLSFWLFIVPVKTLVPILESFNEPINAFGITIILIDIVVFFWWFLLSLKMRTVNKSIQERLSLKKSRSLPVSS